MKINSYMYSYWDLKYCLLRSPKSAAYVIFAIWVFQFWFPFITFSQFPCPVCLVNVSSVSTEIGDTFWDINIL